MSVVDNIEEELLEGLREDSCLFEVMRWDGVETWVVGKLVGGLGGDF